MPAPLVHKETQRTVVLRYKVEAIVEGRFVIADEKVREWAGLSADEPIDDDTLAEYLAENEDDDRYELHEITDWDRLESVRVTDVTERMVAPAAFVPLPGMEDPVPT